MGGSFDEELDLKFIMSMINMIHMIENDMMSKV